MEQDKKKLTIGEIIQENIQTKADISTFIAVVIGGFKAIGLNMEELAGEKEPMQVIGRILPKLALQLSTGGFDSNAFAKFKELSPIIERYKNLAPKDV